MKVVYTNGAAQDENIPKLFNCETDALNDGKKLTEL